MSGHGEGVVGEFRSEFPVEHQALFSVSCTSSLPLVLVVVWIPPRGTGNLSESSSQRQLFTEQEGLVHRSYFKGGRVSRHRDMAARNEEGLSGRSKSA